MKETLKNILKLVDGKLEDMAEGNGLLETEITGISGLQQAGPGDLTFYKDKKYIDAFNNTGASAVLVPVGFEIKSSPCPVIRVKNVDNAFISAISLFVESPLPEKHTIHEKAEVSSDALIEENVHIGPFAVIEPGARIGKDTIIYAGVYIGKNTKIGESCLFWPNVTIRESVTIGNRVIIHSSSVVGSDGFGFLPTKDGITKLPQIGTVVIEDDVEIGACCTIDRARFDKTVISRWTKLDNLIQLAHNVQIGERSMLASQVGISGSTTFGANTLMGGQAGAAGHLTIGSNVIVTARGAPTRDFPDGSVISGFPARDHSLDNRAYAVYLRLPDMRRKVKDLEERLKRLEEDATND